jgi:hypothetical protein
MNDTTGAIYSPPKNGLPFLVVTFADGTMQTQTAASRSEARAMLASKTRRTPSPALGSEAPAGLAKQ